MAVVFETMMTLIIKVVFEIMTVMLRKMIRKMRIMNVLFASSWRLQKRMWTIMRKEDMRMK